MEPIVEELVSREELNRLKDKPAKKIFLGYWYNCIECGWQGHLPSKDQLMCPKCGTPFFFEDDPYNEAEPDYKIEPPRKYSKLSEMIHPGVMGPEVIVNEQPEEN